MKKSLFLLPLLALGLVACGGTTSSGTSTPASESTGPASTEVSASTVVSESTQPESGSEESVEPTPANLIAKIDFTTLEGLGTKITDPTAVLGGLSTEVTWGEAVNVYDGNDGSGGHFSGNKTAGQLKFGVSKTGGSLSFTVSEEVAKVVVNCHSYYGKSESYPENTTNFVALNDLTPVAAPYNETAAGEDVEFVLGTASTSITVKSTNAAGTGAGRIIVYSISLYR